MFLISKFATPSNTFDQILADVQYLKLTHFPLSLLLFTLVQSLKHSTFQFSVHSLFAKSALSLFVQRALTIYMGKLYKNVFCDGL